MPGGCWPGPVAALGRRLAARPVLGILGFRFLYGMKSAGAVLIGTTPIAWPRFALLDALACGIWATVLTALGHASGHLIGRLLGPVQLHWHRPRRRGSSSRRPSPFTAGKDAAPPGAESAGLFLSRHLAYCCGQSRRGNR
ncbi:hypothetical protein MASR1M32_19460 [Rhodobacter sp.]